ncbi:MAG: BtpA/SgcQ family protein [Candidatus Jorgensenbacteria bacterium]
MTRLKTIFGKEHGIVIGAIHLPPLLGYPRFPGTEVTLRNALSDLRAFEDGGVHGVLFENNYDQPHTVVAGAGSVAAMTYVGERIKRAAHIPVGVNVLWNDFPASLTLAKLLNLAFVRVPVFVDTVKTDCGVIQGRARQVVAFRRAVHADRVALFADIHVKHAKLLSRWSLVQSARRAMAGGSDALILTGRWTGEAPELAKLKSVRDAVGDFPILLGSGADARNVGALLRYANGVVVSTSLKRGGRRLGEANVKGYAQRIMATKVKRLTAAARRPVSPR